MNLIADIGNTATKVALAEAGTIVRKERLSSSDPALIGKFIGRCSLRRHCIKCQQ
jgi:pantothenate kinase type III